MVASVAGQLLSEPESNGLGSFEVHPNEAKEWHNVIWSGIKMTIHVICTSEKKHQFIVGCLEKCTEAAVRRSSSHQGHQKEKWGTLPPDQQPDLHQYHSVLLLLES